MAGCQNQQVDSPDRRFKKVLPEIVFQKRKASYS